MNPDSLLGSGDVEQSRLATEGLVVVGQLTEARSRVPFGSGATILYILISCSSQNPYLVAEMRAEFSSGDLLGVFQRGSEVSWLCGEVDRLEVDDAAAEEFLVAVSRRLSRSLDVIGG